MPTVDQILNDTRAFVKEKQASFRKGAAEEALSNPGSIPGSVHDSNVDASMQNSHPETQQEIPAGSKVRSGATDGEDLESGHATNALEPIPGVTQEPLESADALGGNVGSSTVGDRLTTVPLARLVMKSAPLRVLQPPINIPLPSMRMICCL